MIGWSETSLSDATITHEAPRFTVQIPAGFEPFDVLRRHGDRRTRELVDDRILYAFNRGGDPGEEGDYTGVFLRLEHSSWRLVKGFDLGVSLTDTTFETTDWHGRTVRLLRQERRYTTEGDRMVILTAVVPIRGGPIQVRLKGDVKDENRMRLDLRRTLETLDAPVSRLVYAPWLLGGALLGLGVLFAWRRVRRKR